MQLKRLGLLILVKEIKQVDVTTHSLCGFIKNAQILDRQIVLRIDLPILKF